MVEWEVLTGGGFAVVLAFMFVRHLLEENKKQRKWFQELVTNHLEHNTQALIDLRNTMQELLGAIRGWRKDS